MRLIYTVYYTMLAGGGRSAGEAHELARQEIARSLDSSPPDFIRLKRLLTIGATLGAILGFAIFVIGLVVWVAGGSLAPLNIGLALGAFPWSVGAIQLVRRLVLPLQARTWAHREQPLPWVFRPSWIDVVVAAAATCAIAIAVIGSR